MRLFLTAPNDVDLDDLEDRAADLRAEGFEVTSRFDLAERYPDDDLEAALRREGEALLTSQGLAIVPDAEPSATVAIDLLTADGAGIPVLSSDDWALVGLRLGILLRQDPAALTEPEREIAEEPEVQRQVWGREIGAIA